MESRSEASPPLVTQNLLLHRRLAAARKHEEIAGRIDLARDLVERDAVEEAIDDAVWVVALNEPVQRRDIANHISNRNTPAHRVHARDPQRRRRGGDGIIASDQHRRASIERAGDFAASLFPGLFELRHGSLVQGTASYTQYDW